MLSHKKKFFIYIFIDPRKPGKFEYNKICFLYKPFYIGKGKDSRISKHFCNSTFQIEKNIYKLGKIKALFKADFKVDQFCFKIKENLTEKQAFKLETYLIKLIGRRDLNKGPLTNLTDGGEGGCGVRSKNKGKTYEEIYGKEKAEEMKRIRRERFKGDKNPMYGKPSWIRGKKLSKKVKLHLSLINSYPVIQLDLNGNFIKEFPVVKIAAKTLGILKSSIHNCLSPNQPAKTAGGFKWIYKKDYKGDINGKSAYSRNI